VLCTVEDGSIVVKDGKELNNETGTKRCKDLIRVERPGDNIGHDNRRSGRPTASEYWRGLVLVVSIYQLVLLLYRY
jgi:hypothetical protein